MLRCFAVLLLLSPSLALAQYREALVVNFHTQARGASCSSTGQTNGSINSVTRDAATISATTRTETDCSPSTAYLYTVFSEGHTYTLTPAPSAAAFGASMLTAGMSSFFRKPSVLYGVLPGTHVQIRTQGSTFYVKIGKRESAYKLVSAE